MKSKLVIGLICAGCCFALVGCGVTQITSEITTEAGQPLKIEATDFLDVSASKAAEVKIDASGVDTGKVGEYEVKATYKKDEFTLLVKVVDTTAPTVEMKERILYTADLENETYESVVGSVEDVSGYTISLKGTEKVGELSELNDEYVADLDETFEIENMVEGIPSENGIYQGVIAIADEYSNSVDEKIYIVYDTGVVEEEEDSKDVEAVDTDSKDTKDNSTTNKSESKGTSTSTDTNKSTSSSSSSKTTNTSTSSTNKNDSSSSSSSSNSNKNESSSSSSSNVNAQ